MFSVFSIMLICMGILPTIVSALPACSWWSEEGCFTEVYETGLDWDMIITCSETEQWVYSGSGNWGGNCPN